MRKSVAILLLIAVLCLLAACGASKPAEPAPTTVPSAAPAAAPEPTAAPAPEDDGQNPIMNFVGAYSAGRPSLTVEPEGADGALITVHWGSSAWESTEWVMHGEFDSETLAVAYTDGVKTDYVYQNDGGVASETVVYRDGAGRFLFHTGDELTVTWEDEKENAGEGLTFAWYFPEEVVDFADPDAYVGLWTGGRPTLRIARWNDGFKCYITWSSSYAENSTWEYDAYFDGDGLYTFDTGVRTDYVYNSDGSVASSEIAFSTGAARFDIQEDGTLLWTDFMTNPGEEPIRFEPAQRIGVDPTREELVNDYFLVVGGYHQGTSGSSLAMAKAAADVFSFASSHDLWRVPTVIFRNDLLAAWESLSDDERADFDANFVDVLRLLDACRSDWEGNRGLFDDAGAAPQMDALLRDPMACIAWDVLSANTLTMGNSDG